MLDSLIRTFKIFAILLIFAAPALAPEIAIVLAVIGWSAIYLFLGIAALFHSTSADLPWAFVDPDSSFVVLIIVAGLFGLVNGVKGVVAMLVAWTPAFLLPGYMFMIGLAVEHEGNWRGWVRDNYIDPACELTSQPSCVYKPIGGRELPSFVAKRNDVEQVLSVIPYSK